MRFFFKLRFSQILRATATKQTKHFLTVSSQFKMADIKICDEKGCLLPFKYVDL
jgi:hypothetical protein